MENNKKYNPYGMAPSLEELAIDALSEGDTPPSGPRPTRYPGQIITEADVDVELLRRETKGAL